MDKQLELNQLESRQLELMSQMRESDAHSSKCQKLGLVFKDTYPDDFDRYELANSEYNVNETKIIALKKEIEDVEQIKNDEL